MTAKIQLVTKQSDDCHAGAKAPRDATIIAERMGFRQFGVKRTLPPAKWLSWPYLFLWMIKSLAYLLSIPRDALVFVQLTSTAFTGRKSIRMLGLLRKLRHSKIITLVHDLDALREVGIVQYCTGLDVRTQQIVDASDILIVHNDAMKKWFVERGVASSHLVVLKLFDYLSDSVADKQQLSNEIVLAGNLSLNNAKFLLSLHTIPEVKWNLFGPDYDASAVGGANVTYCGCHAPEELPRFLKGSFGLVWDGESVETCSGPFGEYLRYNNPHKCSLYLAAGLPVIVWSESALAGFVRANHLGLCVHSLRDLPAALSALNAGAYDQMRQNVKAVSAKLLAGQFLEAAIREAMSRHAP